MKLKDSLINDNQLWAEEQDRKRERKMAYTPDLSYYMKSDKEMTEKAYKEYEMIVKGETNAQPHI